MNQAQIIADEIMDISPAVANIPKSNPFWVPDGYFEQSSLSLLEIIEFEKYGSVNTKGSVNLLQQQKDEVFSVPEGYFEQFNKDLLDKIQKTESVDDELNVIAPTLIEIRKENPFIVPDGYFEIHADNIIKKKKGIILGHGMFQSILDIKCHFVY